MTERVSKLYRPDDLTDAIDAVQKSRPSLTWQDAANIIKALHADGWKVVRCEPINTEQKDRQ